MNAVDSLASNEHQLIPAHFTLVSIHQPAGANDREALKSTHWTRDGRPEGCHGEYRRQPLH